MPTLAQASFNAGEWNPALFARVDLQKYRSGTALLSNFFVDYRGGASSRPGTRYIIQARDSTHAVRLIPFQAAFNVGYVLELGQNYMRFIFQGQPVLENGIAITAATQANPCVITVPGNAYAVGDWLFISGVVGMTQLNGRYFRVSAVVGANVSLQALPLFSNLNSTAYTAYISGGTAARVYTIATPWLASDLELVKFAQQQNQMVLCHPSYTAQVLTLISATNWTLTNISIGATIAPPTGIITSTTARAGSATYQYVVTSIDATGQESGPSSPGTITNVAQIDQFPGSNSVGWTARPGAVAYNVYEAESSFFGVIPSGAQYGFIATTKGNTVVDTNIAPDFSQTPPVAQNPFVGSGVAFVTVTAQGTYTTVPTVTDSGGSPVVPATYLASLAIVGTPTISAGGTGYAVGDNVYFLDGVVLQVATISAGAVSTFTVVNRGSLTSGTVPTNPISQTSTSGSGTGFTITATWGVGQVIVLTNGDGYTSTPTINFSAGAATATATLSTSGSGNPAVPSFCQQRLVLAGPNGAPQTFYMSQPGSYFNFNITDPVQADNAITGTLVSATLNTIKAIASTASGMLILTDKASWMVNGGASGTAITPTTIVANAQSWVGSSDVPPIIANYDILYVQSKGSVVRDLAFNIYFNVFTGTDITILSSHLFYGFTIKEWAWAEQPFYLAWTVRSDGTCLSLTFLKDQDFTAWTHHTTGPSGGAGFDSFSSVSTTTEPTATAGNIDAVYFAVARTIQGTSVQYIERLAERTFPNGLISAWTVDCALQYVGSSQLNFQGAEQLGGCTVTGLQQDNNGNVTAITPFVMPTSGFFSLPAPPLPATGYTTVTLGLAYTYQLQTLPLEVPGGQSVQGKPKVIPFVDVRVNQTLNLSIGSSFGTLVPMKDTVIGNVSSMLTGSQSSQVVSGLYTGDARTFLDSTYTIPGQYCIQGASPYPASILGVFPQLEMKDD